MAEEEEEPSQPEIVIASEQLAGVWANWARVSYSSHEFTIDFMRVDPYEPAPSSSHASRVRSS